jgi:hypothetical protein
VAVVDSLRNEEDDDFPGVMACAKPAAKPAAKRAVKPKAPLPPPPVLPATPPPEVVCFNFSLFFVFFVSTKLC